MVSGGHEVYQDDYAAGYMVSNHQGLIQYYTSTVIEKMSDERKTKQNPPQRLKALPYTHERELLVIT